MAVTIRVAAEKDLESLLMLYTHLHDNRIPDVMPEDIWREILSDKNHHIVVADDGEKIISSCVCVIIPNLTHGGQPYAVIENVVTDPEYRNRGLATACLNFAGDIAEAAGCYKIMLLTGSKVESTLSFYEKAGFNRHDKTGFIRWLDCK